MDDLVGWTMGGLGLFIIVVLVVFFTWAANDCMKKSCPPGTEPNFNPHQVECLCVARPK